MSTNDSRKRRFHSIDGTNDSSNSPGPSKNFKSPSDQPVPMTSERQPNGFPSYGFPGHPQPFAQQNHPGSSATSQKVPDSMTSNWGPFGSRIRSSSEDSGFVTQRQENYMTLENLSRQEEEGFQKEFIESDDVDQNRRISNEQQRGLEMFLQINETPSEVFQKHIAKTLGLGLTNVKNFYENACRGNDDVTMESD